MPPPQPPAEGPQPRDPGCRFWVNLLESVASDTALSLHTSARANRKQHRFEHYSDYAGPRLGLTLDDTSKMSALSESLKTIHVVPELQ